MSEEIDASKDALVEYFANDNFADPAQIPSVNIAPKESNNIASTPILTPPAPIKTGGKAKKVVQGAKSTPTNDETTSRRSSSRSIKRKKFDDELVESSISYPKNIRSRTISNTSFTPPVVSTGGKGGPSVVTPIVTIPTPITPAPMEVALKQKIKAAPISSYSSRRRRHRQAHNNAVKDIGRWKPTDDLALIIAVQQTNDLEDVYKGVKFSCKFTLKEIEHRWYALLYDPTIAKIGVSAMRQLHPDVVAQVYSKALFNDEEENLLKGFPASSQPTLEQFQDLLLKHPNVFLPYRTSKSLMSHWNSMKHYHLLPDQSTQPLPRHEDVINFSDAEENMEHEVAALGGSLQQKLSTEELLHQEMVLSDRRAKREMRQLENSIPKWQVLVDSITGVAPSDFDHQTLAVLRGRLVRYLMRSKEITLGRCTKDSVVDVDLSLEGPSSKISRKQGLIKLLPNGDFVIANTGKRPFYVDSKPVLGGSNCAKLNNNSVVEIAGLRFVFLINQDLIAAVRTEALKNQM